MTRRALGFGEVAAAYERFRPGYPDELHDLVTSYAGRSIGTALEIGAGTGKAARLFVRRGVELTASEPDPDMIAEMRQHLPSQVRVVRAALEELDTEHSYDLVYAAAALHWTRPEGRWSRVARLVRPGGVFASFGGPVRLADPTVANAVAAARMPFLESDDVPSPDGTPSDHAMQWPGTELVQGPWFADVTQTLVERRFTMSAPDYVGLLSTVSAYLQLAPEHRQEVYRRILAALPPTVLVNADITVHLARRRSGVDGRDGVRSGTA